MCHFMLVQARTRLPLVDETDFLHSQKSPLPGIEPGTSSTAMGRSTHCATGAVFLTCQSMHYINGRKIAEVLTKFLIIFW